MGPQSIPISSSNKTQKSFNFDLTNKQPLNLRREMPLTSKNQKKKLNLTGTLPKGLLSPTNNGYKHKHSDYFESTNTFG
jgi:hypothetical protein